MKEGCGGRVESGRGLRSSDAHLQVPKKIARLFLVSDVLHNSSALVRHAASYRARFQQTLPEIFKSLHQTSQAHTCPLGYFFWSFPKAIT